MIDFVVRRAFERRVRAFRVFGDHEQPGVLQRRDQHVAHLIGSRPAAQLIHVDPVNFGERRARVFQFSGGQLDAEAAKTKPIRQQNR